MNKLLQTRLPCPQRRPLILCQVEKRHGCRLRITKRTTQGTGKEHTSSLGTKLSFEGKISRITPAVLTAVGMVGWETMEAGTQQMTAAAAPFIAWEIAAGVVMAAVEEEAQTGDMLEPNLMELLLSFDVRH